MSDQTPTHTALLPLVSYAPNGEDIVLWRALRHLTPGFFVDVGACHPVVTSITKLFSVRGWRGVNVEPLPHLIDALNEDRPDDVNIQSALSDTPGELTLYVGEEGSHQAYEFPNLLREAGYTETLWDGLNRYFVSPDADDELRHNLSYPACSLDAFVRHDLVEAHAAASAAQQRADRLAEHIDEIHTSSTWKVGAALHAPVRMARRLIDRD